MTILTVTPASVITNGLRPIFSNKKTYIVKCGQCGFQYEDKVLIIAEEATSHCPYCQALNTWSHSKVFELFQKSREQEKLNAQSVARDAILEVLEQKPRIKSRIKNLVYNRFGYTVWLEVDLMIENLVKEGEIKKGWFCYRLIPAISADGRT